MGRLRAGLLASFGALPRQPTPSSPSSLQHSPQPPPLRHLLPLCIGAVATCSRPCLPLLPLLLLDLRLLVLLPVLLCQWLFKETSKTHQRHINDMRYMLRLEKEKHKQMLKQTGDAGLKKDEEPRRKKDKRPTRKKDKEATKRAREQENNYCSTVRV
jgi:hypothetical protein